MLNPDRRVVDWREIPSDSGWIRQHIKCAFGLTLSVDSDLVGTPGIDGSRLGQDKKIRVVHVNGLGHEWEGEPKRDQDRSESSRKCTHATRCHSPGRGSKGSLREPSPDLGGATTGGSFGFVSSAVAGWGGPHYRARCARPIPSSSSVRGMPAVKRHRQPHVWGKRQP